MNKFHNILFVADGSKGEQAALTKILRQAHLTGAEVTVLGVIMVFPGNVYSGAAIDFTALQKEAREQESARLRQLVANCAPPAAPATVLVREGIDYIEIIRQVRSGQHDLVAKAAKTDKGLADALFGVLDMHLLRKCPCPVFIVKPRRKIAHARVLAALDLDEHGRRGDALRDLILDHAAAIAGFEDGSLDILHAWHLPYERNMRKEEKIREIKTVDLLLKDVVTRKQRKLDALAKRWAALAPRTWLIKGQPEEIIPRFTRDHGADLVVMGTVGRTGVKGFFMGNTAEKILRALDCSVLAIKPKGFRSPVR